MTPDTISHIPSQLVDVASFLQNAQNALIVFRAARAGSKGASFDSFARGRYPALRAYVCPALRSAPEQWS